MLSYSPFTMENHLPKQIPGDFYFSDGERINETNMYSGSIIDDLSNIPATYFLEQKSEDLQYWYDFALAHKSPYILNVFRKCDYNANGKEREILFTEVVEDNLTNWAKNNLLLDSNPERLSHAFMRILKSILCGINHFHFTLKRPHSEICSDNIYIVDGKAKLANVVDQSKYKGKSFADDINKFCAMVQQLFKTNSLTIPLELDQLCNSMQQYKNDNRYILNVVNHPILLTPKERGDMRRWAYCTIWGFRHLKSMVCEFLVQELKNQDYHWIKNVSGKEFLETLYFQQTLQQQALQPSYKDTPLDFIRYCRNVGEHVRDMHKPWLTDEYRDKWLTSFLPGFLPILHDVLTIEGKYFRTLPAIK